MSIVIIDNNDSFTYNIYAYISNLNVDAVHVVNSNSVSVSSVKKITPKAIIISPGPCAPINSGASLAIIAMFAGCIPILGICLGHQAIASIFEGQIYQMDKPMHGKVSSVTHNGDVLFSKIPKKFTCMHYHSLAIKIKQEKQLQILAQDKRGTIMAIKHKRYILYGLQFHPESILSEYGDIILKNFIKICQKEIIY